MIRKWYQDLSEEESNELKLKLFNESHMTTKRDVQERVWRMIQEADEKREKSEGDPQQGFYWGNRYAYLDLFCDWLRGCPMFMKLEEWWAYYIEIKSNQIALCLSFYENVSFDLDSDVPKLGECQRNGRYEILTVKTDYLNAEKFSKAWGVKVSTIRQWIRRGKIRNVFKYDGWWMIPELTRPVKRGYSEASYYWRSALWDIPEEFRHLHLDTEAAIEITDIEVDDDMYLVKVLDNRRWDYEDYYLSKAEIQKLERYLIGNPFVAYNGDVEVYDTKFTKEERHES